jgi:hypothetical protein
MAVDVPTAETVCILFLLLSVLTLETHIKAQRLARMRVEVCATVCEGVCAAAESALGSAVSRVNSRSNFDSDVYNAPV